MNTFICAHELSELVGHYSNFQRFTYKFEDFEDSCWCPQHNSVHIEPTTTSKTATTPTTHISRGSCRCLYPKRNQKKSFEYISYFTFSIKKNMILP